MDIAPAVVLCVLGRSLYRQFPDYTVIFFTSSGKSLLKTSAKAFLRQKHRCEVWQPLEEAGECSVGSQFRELSCHLKAVAKLLSDQVLTNGIGGLVNLWLEIRTAIWQASWCLRFSFKTFDPGGK